MLGSLDASFRRDLQLSGSQLRFVAMGDSVLKEQCTALGWKELEVRCTATQRVHLSHQHASIEVLTVCRVALGAI